MLARWTLNLPTRMAGIALQGLITMGTIEFEFGRAHMLHPCYLPTGHKMYIKYALILFVRQSSQ
jgi:hypothetical protein